MDLNGDFMEIQEGYFSLEIQSDDFHDFHGEYDGISWDKFDANAMGIQWNLMERDFV